MAKSTSSGSSSATGDSAGPFGCQYGRTAATKWIEDEAIPAAAVPDQISDQGDGLDPWMELKVTLPGRAKSIDPGVIQHVRSIATFATELEIIDVRPGPAFKNCDELVFRSVKATLTGSALVPDQKVFPFRIKGQCGAEQLMEVAPVHEDIVESAGAYGAANKAIEESTERRARDLAGSHWKFSRAHFAAAHRVIVDLNGVGRIGDHHLSELAP